MYGINEQIKDYINKKIDKNKSFLQNATFLNDDYFFNLRFKSLQPSILKP